MGVAIACDSQRARNIANKVEPRNTSVAIKPYRQIVVSSSFRLVKRTSCPTTSSSIRMSLVKIGP